MADALLADISSWQPLAIDWNAYAAWSRSGDGVARVILRSSQGNGIKDAHFERYWSGAVAAGVQVIGCYHFAYPQLNSPAAEARFFFSAVGSRLRHSDFLMLDYEEQVPQATAAWALAFLQETARLLGRTPRIYASLSYVRQRLQDARLAAYPLVLADWTFNPDQRPLAPAPWKSYEFLQYTDKGRVPGIAGAIDLDRFLGGSMSNPGDWDTMETTSYKVQLDGSLVGSNGQAVYGWILDNMRRTLATPNSLETFSVIYGLATSDQAKDAAGDWWQSFEHVRVRTNSQNKQDYGFASVPATGDEAKIKADIQTAYASLGNALAALG